MDRIAGQLLRLARGDRLGAPTAGARLRQRDDGLAAESTRRFRGAVVTRSGAAIVGALGDELDLATPADAVKLLRQKPAAAVETLVRARMAKTDERCAAARASLPAAAEPPATEAPRLPTSDEAITTGCAWEQWVDLLDDCGAVERPPGRSRAGWPSSRESSRWLGGAGGHYRL
jgi:hypothetical protein